MLAEYDVVELPIPKLNEANQIAQEHLRRSIEALRTARTAIYETLMIGPAFTALRNAINELCEGLIPLGLAERVSTVGCKFSEDAIKQHMGDEELAKLITETLTKLKSITQKAPEPTAPHISTERQIQLHQIESLIGIATYLTNLILKQ